MIYLYLTKSVKKKKSNDKKNPKLLLAIQLVYFRDISLNCVSRRFETQVSITNLSNEVSDERAVFGGLQMESNFTHFCRSGPAFKKVVLLPWDCEYRRGEPGRGFGYGEFDGCSHVTQ
uniref:Uncharacterized protein n=1 Tax=Romanomermis culicivorax TaxID=13658 RepID=A0A915IZK8_ROMCU